MSIFYNPIGAVSIGMLISAFLFSLLAIIIYKRSDQDWTELETGYCWKMKPYKVSPIDDPSKVLSILESTYNGQVIAIDNIELHNRFKKA